jgi:exodeoxyribonuclease VII large subunit
VKTNEKSNVKSSVKQEQHLGELPLFSHLGPPQEGGSRPESYPKAPGVKSERKTEPPKHWTVTELTHKMRGILEPAFSQVWVQGEISNYRPAASGHLYFSLKDQGACLSAAVFGWGATRNKSSELPKLPKLPNLPNLPNLKDGLQVLCRGKISIYPPRGSYQLIVEHIEPLGAGALQFAFEKLKTKLAAEGLFSPNLKRPLPPFPSRIVIVTSPSGAAIQDMLNILKRRAPQIQILVIPALMQGEESPRQVMRGIDWANRYQLGDVLVLARGGGSIEDLWAFNDEDLARAIRSSQIPVISAIGHEIDFTISDFIADVRAPTPSAAAEILSGNWVQAISRFQDASQRLGGIMLRDLTARKVLLAHVAARVVSPRDRVREQAQRVDELQLRIERSFQSQMDRKKNLLNHLVGKLDALSPLRVLKRGYTLVRDPSNDCVLKSVEEIHSGQELKITFYDGQRTACVI